MTKPFAHESTALPRRDALAFAPLHKRHFGTAIGVAAAVLVSGWTVLDMIVSPGDAGPVALLGQYFAGYTVSWRGVLIGGLWAFFVGWIAGWFVAFCRNFTMAAMVFWV
ncbi:MAG TPA: hypothetical protein VFQ22_01900, partial [Longimicrobiales bacterium]|nr:hypothetical protein [Longimicrobiales bacterium]